MKKRFVLPILLSFSSLSGCYLAAEKPSPNGKVKSDYDLTNNIETVCYLGDRVETDNFFITAYFQDYRYFGGYGMCLRIEGKNKKEKKYDVVEAYLCDTYGENINYLIPEPVTYEFFDYNRGYDTVDFYVGSYILRDSFQRDNYEYVVVTQDRTIVFHCWEKPTNYVESGLQESDYNLLNKTPIVAHYENSAGVNPGYFSISRFSGKWIDDTLRITTNTKDFDLVSVFLTDSEDGNVNKLLDTPRAYGNADKMYLDILDANQEYYDSCDNKVKINIITSKQRIIFYTWKTQENGKTKDDYDLSNNTNFDGTFGDRLGKNKEFYCYLDDKKNLKFLITHGDKITYDIVDIYLTDADGENRLDILSKPITLLVSNESYGVTLDYSVDFKNYYLAHDKNVIIHLITEDANVSFYFGKDKQNILGIEEQNVDGGTTNEQKGIGYNIF